MPVYEYRCRSCGHKFSRLVGVIAQECTTDSAHDAGASDPGCPQCGGIELEKLVSRVVLLRSEDEILERLSDPQHVGDPDDPASVRRWIGEVGKEMGEDFGDEFGELVESEETDQRIDLDEEA